MSELALGDQVLVATGKHETVYSFGHRDDTTEASFLRFLPPGLDISMDHMVKRGGSYVPASLIQVGDVLETGTGDMVMIEFIETVTRKGVYAPFTMSGTIIVNDIKASSYVSFQSAENLIIGGWKTPLTFQWIAHLSQGPHRVWTALFGIGEEKYSVEGMSTWIDAPHNLAKWFLNQNSIVMIALLVPALLLLVVISAIEAVVGWLL
jgi:hypothetical protein